MDHNDRSNYSGQADDDEGRFRKRPRVDDHRQPSSLAHPSPPSTAALPPPQLQTSAQITFRTSVQTVNLPIHSPLAYAGPPTPFQKPTQITSFSYSPTRELLLGDRRDEAKATYVPPAIGVDLNDAFDECTWRDGSLDEGLDALLETLLDWEARDTTGTAAATIAKANVVTWRGMLTKLMLAIYEVEGASRGRADGWEMNAMIIDGTLFLEDSATPSKLAAKSASESSYLLQSYYGYSFEAHSTPPFSPPNTNVQWCSVVKTALGSHRVLLGGEVDCVFPGNGGKDGTEGFVELKTNIQIGSQRDEINFERQKLLKHYIQSCEMLPDVHEDHNRRLLIMLAPAVLLGVPTIVVGFRSRPGILTALQSFKTLEIPRLVRGKPHGWDPLLCLSSAQTILSFITTTISSHPASKAAVASEGESGWPVFRISFDPRDAQVAVRLVDEEEVQRDVLGGKKEEERVGFVLKRWVEAASRRRERLSSFMPSAPPSTSAPEPSQRRAPASYPRSAMSIQR